MPDFVDLVRSSVYKRMDDGICDAVMFSCLDYEFMKKEVNASGRHVKAVTTLPLLEFSESVTLLKNNARVTFVDDEGIVLDSQVVFRRLALTSSGHPRSLEYIIEKSNPCSNATLKTCISTAISEGAATLCSVYNYVDD